MIPFCDAPMKKQPPDWWPEGKPFVSLKSGWSYRDNDGRWRDHDGIVLNRQRRRSAGLPK